MTLRMDNALSVEAITKLCESLKRGDRVKVNGELFEFLEQQYTTRGNPQFWFYKIGEPAPVAMPYEYILETCLKCRTVIWGKCTEYGFVRLPVDNMEIECDSRAE